MKFKVWLLILSLLMIGSFIWGETSITTNKIQLQERERVRLEEELRLRLRERLSEQDCEKLFSELRKEAQEEKEYENTLRFMKAYVERNKNFDKNQINEVGKFYRENKNKLEGTTRQKRNTLMQMAEYRVRTRNGSEIVQSREREQHMNTYQNRIQNRNLSQNQENSQMMRQKSTKNRK
ncbi:MAG: hypothetical protein N2258_02955 [Brevinematales bacterium]|nr:hypothetical protein [Brevinematales bacterium]